MGEPLSDIIDVKLSMRRVSANSETGRRSVPLWAQGRPFLPNSETGEEGAGSFLPNSETGEGGLALSCPTVKRVVGRYTQGVQQSLTPEVYPGCTTVSHT